MKTEVINEAEIDGLIKRLNEAIDNDLSLTLTDMQLLLKLLMSFAHLSEQLSDSDITLHKLRKLAGIVSSSEKLKNIVSGKTKEKPQKTFNKPEKEEKLVEHETCHHKIEGFVKGQRCPECEKGTLYKYDPGIFVRITGNAPFHCTKHILEKLRCNTCGVYFTAEVPKEVKLDGQARQTYGYSARAIMAIYKYFGGMPFHRQESLNNLFGMPVSASTIFEQCEHVANAANPVFNYLKKLSSDAIHFHIDDTTNRILTAEKELIPNRKTGKLKERSGIYTSGMIAQLDNGHKAVLFKTNIGHSGEWIDEILRNRNSNAPPPLIMSDALSRNLPTVIKNYQLSLCNAHARREFFDIFKHFPDKVTWVLEQYGKIWINDSFCRGFLPAERLAYHNEHSLPVMQEIHDWGKTQLESGETEENSGLGKATKYFLKHFEALSAFCHIESAKLDNNEMEATLKLIIRGRKNSLFFKTQAGADIADVLTSVISTCDKENVNSFEYLVVLQRYTNEVLQNPHDWLPWNYTHTLFIMGKSD